jgi:hypothetical protein
VVVFLVSLFSLALVKLCLYSLYSLFLASLVPFYFNIVSFASLKKNWNNNLSINQHLSFILLHMTTAFSTGSTLSSVSNQP